MTSYWACAQTHPRQEALALRNLRRQQFIAFYPFFMTFNRHKHWTVQPLFPSYVFIELNDEIVWSPINSTLGVRRLLTMSRRGSVYLQPIPLPTPFVENLRRLGIVRPDGTGRSSSPIVAEPDLIPLGTRVRIVRGAFAERIAIVELASAERVRLLLQVFNREVFVEFEVAAVEVAPGDRTDI